MYTVKVEFERRDVCQGCLSNDRKTVVIKNEVDLFCSLLGVQQQLCDSRIILCWECVALLKKIQAFQNRIQHAQFILQQSLYELDNLPVSPLSTLMVSKKDGADATIEHEERENSPKTKTTEQEPSILRELLKQEINYEDYDHLNYNDDSFSDNDMQTIVLNNLEQKNKSQTKMKQIKVEKPKSLDSKEEIKRLSIKKYECKARVIHLKVDLSDTKKHCSSVILTENEIETVLERDKGYNKLMFKCKECKKAYRRSLDLKRHETFAHIQSMPASCPACDVTVTSREQMERHWRRHNKYLRCNMCGYLSHSVASMTKHHKRMHTTLYSCKACDANCRTLREFSNHYKEAHERIICDHCGKSFVRKKTLEVHIKRHHTPATCFECNRTYAHYHVLENHLRMRHPKMIRAETRTELAYCVECDKQYPSVYKYKRHLATSVKHTPPKPVRVPCPECGKVFARKIRMTNHYKSVHINTTKHRCDICDKTFCSAFSARTHRQHVHEKIPMPKNKVCDICGRGFSTNRILTNHRRTHTGERPYACAHCPATFAQRTAMKTHEKTQHKHAPP